MRFATQSEAGYGAGMDADPTLGAAAGEARRDRDELQRLARAAGRSSWYPTLAFAAVAAAGAVGSFGPAPVQVAVWALAVVLTGALIARHYRREARVIGVVARHRALWALWALATALAFVAGVWAPERWRPEAAWLPIVAGYLVGTVAGAPGFALPGLLVGAVVIGGAATSASAVVVDTGAGLALGLSGAWLRRSQRRRW